MNPLRCLALIPSSYFIVFIIIVIFVFDYAKFLYDRDDTISRQVYRWSLAWRLLRDVVVFAAGFLTCHFFEV